MLARFLDALDARTGLASSLRAWRDAPVPGGARLLHAGGFALLGLLALQALTGVVLAAWFSPSTTTAWASLVHLEEKVLFGKLVRGLHAYGASAVVIGVLVHYVQTVWAGAYRTPREATWTLGLLAGAVVLALGVTGYSLPWDQKGYWSTKVAIGIAGATWGVGPAAARVIQGGDELGNVTLSRFFAAHVVLLPWVLFALVLLHLGAFRRHGSAPPPGASPDAGRARFFPSQAFLGLLLLSLAVAGMVAIVLHRGGAPLEAPADPASDYTPRPEWYFLPLFQLLKALPGHLEPVGSVLVPAGVLLLLVLLPRLDRATSTRLSERRVPLLLALGPLAAAVAVGAAAAIGDASDGRLAAKRDEAERDARLARELARDGVPPDGPLALLDHHPPRLGRRVFRERCQGCHEGGTKGPLLDGYLSQAWLEKVTREPNDPRFFGQRDFVDGMGRIEDGTTADEVSAIALYVRSLEGPEARPRLDPARVARGKALYKEKSCLGCHEVVPGKKGDGPNLAGYGSREWLRAFLEEPGARVFYGERNRMPAFKGKLDAEEMEAVIGYVKGLGGGK